MGKIRIPDEKKERPLPDSPSPPIKKPLERQDLDDLDKETEERKELEKEQEDEGE